MKICISRLIFPRKMFKILLELSPAFAEWRPRGRQKKEKKGMKVMILHEFYTGRAFDAYEYFGAHPTRKGVLFRRRRMRRPNRA